MQMTPGSNPDGFSAMPQMDRPDKIAKDIAALLRDGEVADLFGPKSKMLEEMTGKDYIGWMTADERDTFFNNLPMRSGPLNFDGEACDFCRSKCRFRTCPTCKGESIPVHLRPQRAAEPVAETGVHQEMSAEDAARAIAMFDVPPEQRKAGVLEVRSGAD